MEARKELYGLWKDQVFEETGLSQLTDTVDADTCKAIIEASGDEGKIQDAVISAIGEVLEAAWLEGFDYATRLWAGK